MAWYESWGERDYFGEFPASRLIFSESVLATVLPTLKDHWNKLSSFKKKFV